MVLMGAFVLKGLECNWFLPWRGDGAHVGVSGQNCRAQSVDVNNNSCGGGAWGSGVGALVRWWWKHCSDFIVNLL